MADWYEDMNKCNILALYVFLEFTKEFSMGNIISQLLNLGESEKIGHDPALILQPSDQNSEICLNIYYKSTEIIN